MLFSMTNMINSLETKKCVMSINEYIMFTKESFVFANDYNMFANYSFSPRLFSSQYSLTVQNHDLKHHSIYSFSQWVRYGYSCFLSLLVVAAVLYKVKYRYDVYRRHQVCVVCVVAGLYVEKKQLQ